MVILPLLLRPAFFFLSSTSERSGVFLVISFPVQMTVWIAPLPITAATAPNFHDGLMILIHDIPKLDAVASASLLSYTKTELSRGIDLVQSLTAAAAPVASLIGARAGSLGETASLLIAAGVYQFTPLKNACLKNCRAPAHFMSRYWRTGNLGAAWHSI